MACYEETLYIARGGEKNVHRQVFENEVFEGIFEPVSYEMYPPRYALFINLTIV